MEGNDYSQEEGKDETVNESQEVNPSPRSFQDLLMEYKARVEYRKECDTPWPLPCDQFLSVPVDPIDRVLLICLAEVTGQSQEDLARELIRDGVTSLLERARAEGLASKFPDDLDNWSDSRPKIELFDVIDETDEEPGS